MVVLCFLFMRQKREFVGRNEQQICKIHLYSDSYCTYVCNFYPLEVVDRGSETQLQVGKKFKLFITIFNLFD